MTSTNDNLELLPTISVGSLPPDPPVPLIKSEEDVTRWHLSSGFQMYALFVQRLNEAVAGHDLSEGGEYSQEIKGMITLLDTVEGWIKDIPLQTSSQRFGNLAFRDWGRRLEEKAPDLLATLLPPSLHSAIPHLTPYLLLSFGSFGRIDYGSGHELCFAILLLCLTLLRFFDPARPGEERDLVLRVFLRYLQVIWSIQDVYKLEPAGSHGVWGLDDYHFLSYLWGSAQIRDDPSQIPNSILSPPLPPSNLYNFSISRIHKVKTGPFHEHSPQLYSISMGVAKWSKVNSGLWKMYVAEVLGKRVVVQHVPLGGMMAWDEVTPKERPQEARGVVPSHMPTAVGTQAPWASAAPTSTSASPRTMNLTSLPPLTRRTPTVPRMGESMPPPTTFPSRRPQDQL